MMRAAFASGFTLIEVMIALVVIALSMASVMFASSSASERLFYLREKAESAWVANNIMVENTSGERGMYLGPSSASGNMTMGQGEYRWFFTAKKVASGRSLQLQVQVRRASDEALLSERVLREPFYEMP